MPSSFSLPHSFSPRMWAVLGPSDPTQGAATNYANDFDLRAYPTSPLSRSPTTVGDSHTLTHQKKHP